MIKEQEMQYTYEFEMWRGEFAWIAAPFDLVGITQGVDVEDVCESAADLLRELAREYLMRGETPPKATFDHEPSHGGVRLIVSVDVTLDDIEKVSAAQAAELLCVSRSRVTAMLHSGLLEGWKDGRNTWVAKASIDARLASRAPAGRPKAGKRE